MPTIRTKTALVILSLCIPLGWTASAPARDYAAWSGVNPDGSWTRAAEQAISRVALANTTPRDVNSFCPRYTTLSHSQRIAFWVALVSAMARPESNFKPEATYLEPNVRDNKGQRVTSRGLLQISQESANQRAYACEIKHAEDLHNPSVNLDCTSRIMAYWVKKDERIAIDSGKPLGGARYWSVLRGWKGHLPEIKGFTRKLPGCMNS